MKMRLIAAMMMVVCLVGCHHGDFYKGMNTQRSALRGTGDIAISASLDAVPSADSAEAIKAETVVITESVRRFLESGAVANLTIPELTEKLNKIVPEKYRFLVDILIAQISGVTLPVDIIGVNNVRRIDAACKGILTGCAEYKISDRPTANKVLGGKRSVSVGDLKVFEARLRKEIRRK